jgi:tetratricopeptide (TPR) repeat protein
MSPPTSCLRFVKAPVQRRDADPTSASRPIAWLVRAALLCLTLSGAVAHAQAPPTPDPVEQARRLVDAGRAQAALDLLDDPGRAGSPSPADPGSRGEDARHLHVRGLAHYHLGDAPRAIPLLERARSGLTEGAERQHATEVLGLALMLAGRAVDAVPHLEAAVQARRSPEVAHVLAQAAVQAGQPDTARRALALALGLDVDRAEAFVAAGQLMARLDMHEMAEHALRAAVARNPSVMQAHYLLGQEALFRGRLEEAVTLTRRELTLNPLDAMALAQLGDALTRLNQWDEALPVLQRAIWLNPYYSAPYILLGRGHLRAGHPDLAEGMARRAIAFDPNNRTAHYLLGQVLQQLGQPAAAKEAFARAEQLQQQGRR